MDNGQWTMYNFEGTIYKVHIIVLTYLELFLLLRLK